MNKLIFRIKHTLQDIDRIMWTTNIEEIKI